MKKKFEKPKCSKCGSGQVYLRLRTNEYICRVCGEVTKKTVKFFEK